MEFLIKDDVLDNVCNYCKTVAANCLTKKSCPVYKVINKVIDRTKTYELDPTIYLNADGCEGCMHEDKDAWEYPCKDCKNAYVNKWTPKPPKEICENCENWNKIEYGKGTCDRLNETIVDADFYCKGFTGKGIFKWMKKEEL